MYIDFIYIYSYIFIYTHSNIYSYTYTGPDRVITKTEKMVLNISFLYIQHNKARIKSKMEQFRERSSALLTFR